HECTPYSRGSGRGRRPRVSYHAPGWAALRERSEIRSTKSETNPKRETKAEIRNGTTWSVSDFGFPQSVHGLPSSRAHMNHQVCWEIESRTNRTLPSHRLTCTPPGWRLRDWACWNAQPTHAPI